MTAVASGLTAAMLAVPDQKVEQKPRSPLCFLAYYMIDYSKPFRAPYDLISLWLDQDGNKMLVHEYTKMYSPGKGDVNPDSLSVVDFEKISDFLKSKEWIQRSDSPVRSIVEEEHKFDLIDQIVIDSFSLLGHYKDSITQYNRTIVYTGIQQ